MRAAIRASLALGLMSTSALGADLGPWGPPGSIKDAPLPDFIPAFSWTGIYLGAQGGFAWSDVEFDDGLIHASWTQDGWFGGGYIGFNWQLNSLVVGLEGDVNGADIDGTSNAAFRSDIDSFASARGRIGLAADRVLFFVTGGWAWADANVTDLALSISEDTTLQGWTLGGGIEFAFTDRVIGRIEGRHYEFDSENLTALGGSFDADLNTVSAGLAVKF
jgi:outer membrane immunogenic protein